MEEMMNYIFKNILDSQEGIKRISKCLKNQSRFNKQVVLFTLASTYFSVLLSIDVAQQRKEIKELQSKVAALQFDKIKRNMCEPKGE